MIITIGRQLGSGGREIGKKLAEAMNIAYYDKELLDITAKESGLNRNLFEQTDERTTRVISADILSMRFPFWGDAMVGSGGLSNEALFQIQSDVIRSLADQHSCVFIGRCADYILRDRKDCVSVFICADDADRIERIIRSGKDKAVSEEQACDIMMQVDKRRAAYYHYYSSKTWGMASSYHVCLNSSVLGVDGAVDFLRKAAEKVCAQVSSI